MCKLSDSGSVPLEDEAADVGDGVMGEPERGIETERLGLRRVVSPGEPVRLLDEEREGVVIGEPRLEGLAATPQLFVEDRTAEGVHVVDVVHGP